MAIVLTLLTFGIYGIYWNYVNFEEISKWRGKGVGGLGGVALALIGVSPFLLGSYVGQMYREANEDPPVSGATGLWMFPGAFILIGPIIFFSKVQGAINVFWALQGEVPDAAPAATAT
jgi:hypothetical protein